MNKIVRSALLLGFFISSTYAADRTLNLSNGCKVYQLDQKKWVEVDAGAMDKIVLADSQILKDETFTVFKVSTGTFGVNKKCVVAGEAEPNPTNRPQGVPHRAAAPAPIRGDTHSPWSAVFSFGYNMLQAGNQKTTYNGAVSEDKVKYKGSFAFLGEGNYRVNAAFRLAAELGLSQLTVDAFNGNETSFFDARPEYVFRAGKKIEAYIGPMVGLFFLSQNKEERKFATGPAAGTTIDVKEQTATALLVGIGAGMDWVLTPQFDLGFYFRYFKPGTLKVTGTETFPTPGNTYEASLSTSYITGGARFVVHF
jgi:hypothetical protein